MPPNHIPLKEILILNMFVTSFIRYHYPTGIEIMVIHRSFKMSVWTTAYLCVWNTHNKYPPTPLPPSRSTTLPCTTIVQNILLDGVVSDKRIISKSRCLNNVNKNAYEIILISSLQCFRNFETVFLKFGETHEILRLYLNLNRRLRLKITGSTQNT